MSTTSTYRRAFHGTSKAALAGILKDGIIPSKSEGADAWANNRGSTFRPRGAVFLSYRERVATAFSQFAAQVRAGTWDRPKHLVEGGVVLEIDLRQADPSKIEADSKYDLMQDDAEAAFMYHGAIPASWIKCYREVHPTMSEFPGYDVRELIDRGELGLALGEPVEVAA